MSIENLFPTPVGFYKLERSITSEEHKFCNSLELEQNFGNNRSCNNYILDSTHLSNLRSFIKTKIDDFFRSVYDPVEQVSLQITQSWLNISKEGDFHHQHSHPNSFVSGVFYVQADQTLDRINFFKRVDSNLNVSPKNYNAWNSEKWWFPVGTNDLLLFPSHLSHMVEKVTSKIPRISIAFNTFPIGIMGEDKRLDMLNVMQVK